MNCYLTLGIAALLVAASYADDPKELEAARTAYKQSVQRATEPLKARYLADLARLREGFTRAGKLPDALAIENEMRALSGQAAVTPVGSSDSPKATVAISARSDTGAALGPAKKGQRLRLQYVEGLWSSTGDPSVSPDNAPHAFVKVAVIGLTDGKEEVVMIVPNGTKSRAATEDFKKDYEQVWLRINDHTKNDNVGEVTYKAAIK